MLYIKYVRLYPYLNYQIGMQMLPLTHYSLDLLENNLSVRGV